MRLLTLVCALSMMASPALAGTTIPEVFRGTWDSPANPTCDPQNGEAQVTIDDKGLYFSDASASVQNVKVKNRHEVVLDLVETVIGSEGSSEGVRRLALSDDEKFLIVESLLGGTARHVLVRCPAK